MKQQPWISGPSEILKHGLSLLVKDNDENRRLAMITIDNAVELMIKTYLGLPKRVTGIKLSRKEFAEICESFPQLLDALEQHANDKLNGIDLGEIEWYHRLRNELYHQGNGLTVVREKVEVYAELSKLLFKNLFSFTLDIKESNTKDILSSFMSNWVKFEQYINQITTKLHTENPTKQWFVPKFDIRILVIEKIIDDITANEITYLRKIRNQVVHGSVDYKTILNKDVIKRITAINKQLEQYISENK